MKPQFVTCIYTNLEGTRFNGNNQHLYLRYQKSLESLARGGYGIVCYTAAAHYIELRDYFAKYPNVTIIIQELNESQFHAEIEAIKDRHPEYCELDSWRSRCVEIMWGKFVWMQNHLAELDEGDSLFWIDAGIFHGGLITNAFRSETSVDFYDFDLITQKRNFYEDLVRYCDGKILNIRSHGVNHSADGFSQVYNYRPEYSIIGGMFGGKRDLVGLYTSNAIADMQRFLDAGILVKEEEIMFHLNNVAPQSFTPFAFTSWYHQDWDFFDANNEIAFSDFFKVIASE